MAEIMRNIARFEVLEAVEVANAPLGSKEILENSLAQLGRIPNMYSLMANSPGLLKTYRMGYDAFRSESGFSNTEQEVVLLTISRFHECTYCVAVHSSIADMNKVDREVTDAIRNGDAIRDVKLESLRVFTTTMLVTRGRPKPEDLATLLAAGFTELQVLEIILAIAVKTISNYSNHLFDTQLDSRFSARKWQP
jgi:uncharacterized peroxidase-related enzyme